MSNVENLRFFPNSACGCVVQCRTALLALDVAGSTSRLAHRTNKVLLSCASKSACRMRWERLTPFHSPHALFCYTSKSHGSRHSLGPSICATTTLNRDLTLSLDNPGAAITIALQLSCGAASLRFAFASLLHQCRAEAERCHRALAAPPAAAWRSCAAKASIPGALDAHD